MLAWRRGDHERALHDLEHARVVSRAAGAWPWVAAADIELARALEHRGAPGDREHARALRTAAVDAARAGGWGPLMAGGAPAPAVERRAPVSPW